MACCSPDWAAALWPLSLQGMLNVWHLVAYQRYYDGLISATGGSQHSNQHRPAAQLNAMGSNIVDVSVGP